MSDKPMSRRLLNVEGKQRVCQAFLSGGPMSEIASVFGVSRREIEQAVREALRQLAVRVKDTMEEPQR
jgi:DNA-directed RNA polymerase specialized sigma24 family protein